MDNPDLQERVTNELERIFRQLQLPEPVLVKVISRAFETETVEVIDAVRNSLDLRMRMRIKEALNSRTVRDNNQGEI